MNRIIPFAAENDIVVTIPTGNDAPSSLAMVTPQNLGTTDNALITVAGVERDGSLFTTQISVPGVRSRSTQLPGWYWSRAPTATLRRQC